MNAGDTIIQSANDPAIDSHLWVVVSDPSLDDQHVVVLSFTTNRQDKDQSCVIQPGEHPFVTRETVVYFADPKSVSNDDLDILVSKGLMQKHAPVSRELLARIRQGAWESEDIPIGVRQILLDQGLLD